jgi:hypothetical protein
MLYPLSVKTGLCPVCSFCEPAFPPDDGRYRQPKHVAEVNKNQPTKSKNLCCSESKINTQLFITVLTTASHLSRF